MFLVGLLLAWIMKEEKNRIKFEKESSERRKSGMSIDIDPDYSKLPEEEKKNTELRESLLGTEGESANENMIL